MTVQGEAHSNLPAAVLLHHEAGYAADAHLVVLRLNQRQRILSSLPQTLRNLRLRNRVYGRFGQFSTLHEVLLAHGDAPENPILRFRWSAGELAAVENFLENALQSCTLPAGVGDDFAAFPFP